MCSFLTGGREDSWTVAESDESYGFLSPEQCAHVYVHALLYLILQACITHPWNPDLENLSKTKSLFLLKNLLKKKKKKEIMSKTYFYYYEVNKAI